MTDSPRTSRLYAAAAIGAAIITIVFATVGDGVDSDNGGLQGFVIDHGHTAVWALLAAALGIAAVRGSWQQISGALAAAALAIYVVFVGAVVLGSAG